MTWNTKPFPINTEISKRGAEGAQVSAFCLFFDYFIRSLSNYLILTLTLTYSLTPQFV